jgi:DnaD/phage-associated family protein
MAERRAIKSAIWDDTWFGRLSSFQMVVWIGLFSKCADDQGRFQNDPALIRSKLFPFQDVLISEVSEVIKSFDGHLFLYTKGEPMAQIIRWWENQPMQYAVPSNYPPPDEWIDCYRTTYKSKSIVYNWKGMENNSIGILLWNELKNLARQSSWTSLVGRLNPNPNPNSNPVKNGNHEPEINPELAALNTVYEENIGVLSQIISETVEADLKEFGLISCKAAVLEAVKNNVRKWSYVQGILRRWKVEGRENNNGHSSQPVKPMTFKVDFGDGVIEERTA